MKKIFAVIFMVVYVSASGGHIVNIQYCVGEVASVKINDTEKVETCNTCGMEDTESCCSNEYKIANLDDEYNATVTFTITSRLPSATLIPVSLIDASKLLKNMAELNLVHDPPRFAITDIHILNCSFRV